MLVCRQRVSEATAHKLKARSTLQNRSHTAHTLETTLSPAQESVAVELRRTLLLFLNDLLAIAPEFLHSAVSRSGLDRCLRRHGLGNLNALKLAKPKEPHMICNYMRQSEALGMSHAALCAEPLVGNEAFAMQLADDLMIG